MDLRDEVSGTEGTIWLNNYLRTGFEMFTAVGQQGYVAEKTESDRGWLFPIGDDLTELGYVPMFAEMFDAIDKGTTPSETFYDGYVVNAIMDACYRSAASKRWEPVELAVWRGDEQAAAQVDAADFDEAHTLVKEELLPDGRTKLILKEKATGRIVETVS
jgi:hypothetical protein